MPIRFGAGVRDGVPGGVAGTAMRFGPAARAAVASGPGVACDVESSELAGGNATGELLAEEKLDSDERTAGAVATVRTATTCGRAGASVTGISTLRAAGGALAGCAAAIGAAVPAVAAALECARSTPAACVVAATDEASTAVEAEGPADCTPATARVGASVTGAIGRGCVAAESACDPTFVACSATPGAAPSPSEVAACAPALISANAACSLATGALRPSTSRAARVITCRPKGAAAWPVCCWPSPAMPPASAATGAMAVVSAASGLRRSADADGNGCCAGQLASR